MAGNRGLRGACGKPVLSPRWGDTRTGRLRWAWGAGDNREEAVMEGRLLRYFARTWDICFLTCPQDHVEP